MIKFRLFSDTKKISRTEIKIVCRPEAKETLMKLLEFLQMTGHAGHSHDIILDPNSEGEETLFWDGDGSDQIYELSESTVEVEKSFSDKMPPKDSKARIEWAKENGVIYKGEDGWHIISLRTGKDWSATYDTEKNAEDALKAYHASKH